MCIPLGRGTRRWCMTISGGNSHTRMSLFASTLPSPASALHLSEMRLEDKQRKKETNRERARARERAREREERGERERRERGERELPSSVCGDNREMSPILLHPHLPPYPPSPLPPPLPSTPPPSPSPSPFPTRPKVYWGWGGAWRRNREFVGNITYGARYVHGLLNVKR